MSSRTNPCCSTRSQQLRPGHCCLPFLISFFSEDQRITSLTWLSFEDSGLFAGARKCHHYKRHRIIVSINVHSVLLKNLHFLGLFGLNSELSLKNHACLIYKGACRDQDKWVPKQVCPTFWKISRISRPLAWRRTGNFLLLLLILRLKEPATKAAIVDPSDGLSDNLSDE